jgi:hypothetical protein
MRYCLRAKKRKTVEDKDENKDKQDCAVVESKEVEVKRKRRVTFAQTEVQVQRFFKNVSLSASPKYDGSQMPKKGVLKTSRSPSAKDISSDHVVSSKMSIDVKSRRSKAVDFF